MAPNGEGNIADDEGNHDDSSVSNSNDSKLEILASRLMEQIQSFFEAISRVTNATIARYRMKEAVIFLWDQLQMYPWLAPILGAILLVVSLPFMMFIVFAVGTSIMAFTGFVLVEGTLLTVASMLLVGVVLCVGFIFGTIGLFLLVGYFGINQAYDIFERRRRGVVAQ